MRRQTAPKQESQRNRRIKKFGEVAEWLTRSWQSQRRERRRNDGDPKGEERSDE